MSERPIPNLVSPSWLAERLGQPDLRIVDCRWRLGDPGAGRKLYATWHLPGAAFLDVDTDLAAPPGKGPGRHPLPPAHEFERTMARIGTSDDTRVVAYDDVGGAVAARLWFLLRYFGHETGAVLDGGIQAWQAAELPLESAVPSFPSARFSARPRPELVVDRAAVAQLSRNGGLLIDARNAQRYRGELEPIDPRPGHVPGAKSAPFTENLVTVMGPFRPAAELSAHYRRLGADRGAVVYCGSGVTACHDLLAMELAGISGARLYEGSWSDWSSQPDTEAATGDE